MDKLTPYEQYIVKTVAAICRDTGQPARTVAVAARHEALSKRSVQRYLNTLEKAGIVKRLSPKTGYVAVAA